MLRGEGVAALPLTFAKMGLSLKAGVTSPGSIQAVRRVGRCEWMGATWETRSPQQS